MLNLKDWVGRSAEGSLDDVLPVKNSLKNLGFYQEPDYGMTEYPDEEMYEGIKQFQQRHHLKVDGEMQPGGETENKLNEVLASAGKMRMAEASPQNDSAGNQEETGNLMSDFLTKAKDSIGLSGRKNILENNPKSVVQKPEAGLLPGGFAKPSALPNRFPTTPAPELQNSVPKIPTPSLPATPAGGAQKFNGINYEKYGKDANSKLVDEMLLDERFSRAMERTRLNEGGYSDNKKDRGGKTKYGITSKWYPNEDIDAITRERADYILYRDYWKTPKINQLDEKVSDIVFDHAVNVGQQRAISNLQEAIGGIKQDGYIGKETMDALKNMDIKKFNEKFKSVAGGHYEKILKKDTSQKEFIEGWLNRINSY